MEFAPQNLIAFRQLIEQNEKILILSHRRPDADTIGGAISMYKALSRLGKKITLACKDQLHLDLYFMPYVYLYTQNFGKPTDYDLIIVVDCGDATMTLFHKEFPDIWSCGVPVINIDHHRTNDLFGSVNIVKPTAASTTLMLYFLYKKLRWEIDNEMANLLFAGLSFDTGHFKHDNTTVEVLEVAGELVEKGANPTYIAKYLFNSIPTNTLKVWGEAMKRIKINNYDVASTLMTEDDATKHKADKDALKTSELVSYINSIPEAKFCLVLSENKGLVKGSMRTQRDDVDVSEIANKCFGGGGHKKAAGFAIRGKLHIDQFEKRLVE